MKAILLAAGMGTRLRPLTDTIPKCLIPINKKPLLEIWIDLLKQHNITSILVNTHHHANTVDRFIQQTASNTLLKITSFYEKKLLGSGGTVFANQDFVADDKNFIIAYADNLTDINLSKMISFHNRCRSKGGILTMGLFRTPDPESCGIVTLDHNQRIMVLLQFS